MIGMAIGFVIGLWVAVFLMPFAFHCGFVWGRWRVSAHEFWKRGMTYESPVEALTQNVVVSVSSPTSREPT